RLHAALAADARLRGEVHDPIRALEQRPRWADLHARRVLAVLAALDREVAAGARELPLLHVLHPGAELPHRHLVLRLTGHRTRVAANTRPLVDHEAVLRHPRPVARSPASAASAGL